jgi:hypothetical protein
MLTLHDYVYALVQLTTDFNRIGQIIFVLFLGLGNTESFGNAATNGPLYQPRTIGQLVQS